MTGLAVLAALGAAASYALSATLQHRAARHEPAYHTGDPRLLFRLLRRPVWLGGAVFDITGVALQAVALALGPLALVQPMLISGLIMAIPMEAAFAHRQVRERDLAAVAVSALGLGLFVIITAPSKGSENLSDPALGAAAAVLVAIDVLLLHLAKRSSGHWRATILGIATGALFGLGASLAKAAVGRFVESPASLFTGWQLYLLIPVGLTAVVLNQNAYQASTLAGPLTGITLTDPLVSIIIAVTVFGETLHLAGARGPLALMAAILMGWGVWLVSSAWAERPHPP